MRRIAERLLQLYVFTVPWESVAALPGGLMPLARLSGVAAVGMTVLAVVAEGRLRKSDAILGSALAFVGAAALSLLWAVPFPGSNQAVFTYVQLLGSVWITRELARTPELQRRLLTIFCFGLYVPLLSFLGNIALGGEISVRGEGLLGPSIAPSLVIGIPIAFHLAMTSAGAVRAVAFVYIPLAMVVTPMTGGRAAFIAGAVSLVAMTLLARHSRRFILLLTGSLVVASLTVPRMLPQATFDRLSGIPGEIAGGHMNYRRPIWNAGLAAFPEHPILGSGVATFGVAVKSQRQTFFAENLVAHNVFIGILVEQGIVGITLFVTLLGACAVTILRLPPQYRTLWAVLALSWLTQAQAGSLERGKITWLLFALLAAHHAVGSKCGAALPMYAGTETNAPRRRPSWAASAGVAPPLARR